MSAILKFDFQKREQLRFSEENFSKLRKKDPILHVATTFSLKQGETRTSHGPIPHSLSYFNLVLSYTNPFSVTPFTMGGGFTTQVIFKRIPTLSYWYLSIAMGLLFPYIRK